LRAARYCHSGGLTCEFLDFQTFGWHPFFKFFASIFVNEVLMKPWLGAQEVLYESLLWHLKVPKDYASQVAANKLVFPGESMVNIANPPNTHSAVNLEGYVDAWITDIECATSLRPRLYGFDYGRVADIFYQGDDKVLLTTKPQDDRKATGSIPSEKAMMKDLMLSCYAKGGEICLSYHMLNPFIAPADSGLDPLKYHTGQSDTHLGSANFQSEFAAQSDTPTPSDTVTRGGREMGTFLEELLSHPMADGKDIYIRLFHEPNIDYFWWGEAGGNNTAPYMDNFISLWNLMVGEIRARVDPSRHARIKFVFCINGKETPAKLANDLDRYFPTGGGVTAAQAFSDFLNSISVLGLDYYEDWKKDPAQSNLIAEYQLVIDKVTAVNTQLGQNWDHALTEVSIRTKEHTQTDDGIKTTMHAKLYGEYDAAPPTEPSEAAWPESNRSFFKDAVFELARTKSPKWVMFWVNRLGNSAISKFTPPTSNGISLHYGQTNVFTDQYAEMYYPMLPAEPFYVETFKHGHVDGNGVQQKTFMKIAAADPDLLNQIPGATTDGDRNDHGTAYQHAVTDFFDLVPDHIKTWNAGGILAVEAFEAGTLSRPDFGQTPLPPNPNAADIIFDTL